GVDLDERPILSHPTEEIRRERHARKDAALEPAYELARVHAVREGKTLVARRRDAPTLLVVEVKCSSTLARVLAPESAARSYAERHALKRDALAAVAVACEERRRARRDAKRLTEPVDRRKRREELRGADDV